MADGGVVIQSTSVGHRYGPYAGVSGVDIALRVYTVDDETLFQSRETEGFGRPHYNIKDEIFGFIDYETMTTSTSYQLYDFLGFVELQELYYGTL